MVKYSEGDDRVKNKIEIYKKNEPGLFNMMIVLIVTSIVSFGLAFLFGKISLLSSYLINISVGAITILFTVFYVDKIQKESKARELIEQEKINKYNEWKFKFMDDKQKYVRFMDEVATMIDIITECYSEGKCILKEENISILVDLLKIQIRVKLANTPLRYSFENTEWMMVVRNNKKDVNDIISEVECTIKEVEKYINSKEFTSGQLKSYSAKLFQGSVHLLSLVPRRFEDIKDNIKL